ncbi:hypothetical protein [Fluviicola sp.]|uniref:hypothetical protein n=1 Tax=Fluviicola sp. TaxID=1917219 RepID=UPI0031D5CBC0
MKLSGNVLFFLIVLSWFLSTGSHAQTDRFSEGSGLPAASRESVIRSMRIHNGYFDTFWTGPRVSYMQGKHGFLGVSGAFMWHNIGYIPEAHIGFAAGMDFRLTKSAVYVPKLTFEGRYAVFLARVGYSYLTDFKSDSEHRFSAEIGFSLLSFLDITYLHSFGSKRNPFGLNNDYFNLTVTIPLNSDW